MVMLLLSVVSKVSHLDKSTSMPSIPISWFSLVPLVCSSLFSISVSETARFTMSQKWNISYKCHSVWEIERFLIWCIHIFSFHSFLVVLPIKTALGGSCAIILFKELQNNQITMFSIDYFWSKMCINITVTKFKCTLFRHCFEQMVLLLGRSFFASILGGI